MGESHGTTENWIEKWIEEQRERLRASRSAGRPGDTSAEAGTDDAAAKWQELGREMWRSFQQFASNGLVADIPSLGWLREHEQAWRALGAADARWRDLEAQLQVQLAGVQAQALASLERKVRERAEANRPIGSARELYDLWIECGEQSYAQLVHSEAYCRLQADVANAGLKLRACQQTLIERALKHFDLPTRAELNSVHRQIRELRERLEGARPAAKAKRAKPSARATASAPRRKAGRKSK